MTMWSKSFLGNLKPILPLMAIYLVVTFVFSSDILFGDEKRYIDYAGNLTKGYFFDTDNPSLRNGPGYPLVLAPFVALGIDILPMRIANALFVFIGIVFFYLTLRLYLTKTWALVLTYFMGLYLPLLRWMPVLYSEALSFVLVCGLMYFCCTAYRDTKSGFKSVTAAAFCMGYLILTKVIFFHVMVVSVILLFLYYIVGKQEKPIHALRMLGYSFVLVVPYLIYTYSLTGKPFYLSTGGGEILYHRSSPYENEWGNWFSATNVLVPEEKDQGQFKVNNDLSVLSKNHREIYEATQTMSHIEKDLYFKEKAFENMRKYPLKYAKNSVSNIGRLLFNYPNSYRSQNMNAFGYLIPNMFILVLFVFAVYPAYRKRKSIPFEIKALLTFASIYIGGMMVMGGKGRYFVIMIPLLLLFIGYVYTHIFKITIACEDIDQ